MIKPKPTKPFKTLDEEAEFWDTHDLSDVFKDPKIPLSKLTKLKTKDFDNQKSTF